MTSSPIIAPWPSVATLPPKNKPLKFIESLITQWWNVGFRNGGEQKTYFRRIREATMTDLYIVIRNLVQLGPSLGTYKYP